MNVFFAIFLLLCSSGSSSSFLRFSSAISPDGLTLLAFKSAVSGEQSAILADWDEEDEDPCRWPGVSCANVSGFSYMRVVALTVTGKNLSGYIPSELGSLIFLRRLNLHGNRLSGPIPAQISNALNLHSLFLYSNNFSGPVPASLCNLPQLQNLDLSQNSLSGPIPNELRLCRQLQRLHLSGNRLSGAIPAGIWLQLDKLLELDLSMNNLTGPLPPDLGSLRSLSGTLNLSYNQFSGEIPGSIGNLSTTLKLDLRFNNLSGEIPMLGSLANQNPNYFAGNPRLCGIILLSPCKQIRPPASQNRQISIGDKEPTKKGLSRETIVLIAAANSVAMALILLALVYTYSKMKDSRSSCSCTGRTRLGSGKKNQAICCRNYSGSDSDEAAAESEAGGGALVLLDEGFSCEIEELLQASAYVLGKGRMGILYKVVLGNGSPVAVRRLSDGGAAENRRDFATEVSAIARVKHPNVVRLKAYYWSSSEKLLISEFVSHGCLASALRQKLRLSLTERLKIAKGIARGITCIHETGPRKLVHGGIKPCNILLDSELNPYISDLGLAGMAGGGGGGSASYLPPEALAGGRPAQSWDVYAFGMVLLELLTGRSTEIERKKVEEGKFLPEMVDSAIRVEAREKRKAVAMVLRLGFSCTEVEPSSRPRMRTVSEKLDKVSL